MPSGSNSRGSFLLTLLGVFGAIAFFAGGSILISEWGASVQPVAMDLAEFEAGGAAPDMHVSIGEHVALYDSGIVAYRLKEGQTAPERGARLLSYLYPIVSTDNPLATSDPNARNEGVFRVMVRTSRYFSEGEVPRTPQKAASVTGMLRSTLTARNIENGRLLAQQFPGVDPDSVMVLEDRQQPMNILAKLGLMLAGMSLLLLAWIGRRARLASQSMAAAVPFLEHFSQAFARFFMRVGLPSGIAPFK